MSRIRKCDHITPETPLYGVLQSRGLCSKYSFFASRWFSRYCTSHNSTSNGNASKIHWQYHRQASRCWCAGVPRRRGPLLPFTVKHLCGGSALSRDAWFGALRSCCCCIVIAKMSIYAMAVTVRIRFPTVSAYQAISGKLYVLYSLSYR
jgi:hypothetical protein